MRTGNLILTRYKDESKNTSPGYWNHVAIVSNRDSIIESLRDEGVVELNIKDSLVKINSLDIVYRVIEPFDKQTMEKAGERSIDYLGLDYRFSSSIFKRFGQRRLEKGVNCVTLARLIYKDILGYDPRWKRPDDILEKK